jgi:voltage-gated potassium channel
VTLKGEFRSLVYLTAPLRRLGVSSLARLVVIAMGLGAVAALTTPDLSQVTKTLLLIFLWCCLAGFAFEAFRRARDALRTGRDYFLWPPGIIDMLAVLPVPIALTCGVGPPTAWLFATLWLLKLAENTPGFAQLGRVIMLEARPLASVLVLFSIILFLAASAMYVLERDQQPQAFGSLPAALWWAVVTITTTGYGDEVPHSYLGHVLGAFVMICGIATFGLLTGILATGFAAESRRRNFIQTWDLVSKVPFFQSLDPAAIAEITHMLRRLDVPERTAIIRRGKVGDCMYFIADGEVEVDVKPAPVRLGAGAFFGELALLGDSVRTANVTTTGPSTLLLLDLADFRTFTAHHPDLARAIDAEAQRRMSENQRLREVERPAGATPA